VVSLLKAMQAYLFIPFLLLSIFAFNSVKAAPLVKTESRTWNIKGVQVEGKMGNSNLKVVVVTGADGKKHLAQKSDLSPEDTKYVEDIEAQRSGKVPEAPSQAEPQSATATPPPASSAATATVPPSTAPTPAAAQKTDGGGVVSDGREWAETGGKFNAETTLATLKPGYTFKNLMVPMRDGVGLATTVFIPPGDGPWATILIRTPYERNGGAKYFKGLTKDKDYACVIQDPRGDGDSKGSPGDPVNNEIEIYDGYDTIDWVVKQPWCNGRVGMTGGSGNGMCAAMAYLSKHPNLVVVTPSNSAGNSYLYWSFENGVRRWMYNWLSNRNLPKKNEWPKPTIYSYDMAKWNKILDDAARDNKTVYIGDDGWFNIFCDGAVDTFERFAATGKVFINIGSNTHGAGSNKGVKFKMKGGAATSPISFLDVLDGKPVIEKSFIKYDVLGDIDDTSAPGNTKKVSEVWPVPSKPVSFYFTGNGGLSEQPPSDSASVPYTYDPKNPASTLGGGWSFSDQPNGAVDQTPLKERKDIVRFVSEPLTAPLEVVGKLKAELCFSTDVQDTAFIVKFVDIYPDGKELIIREGAGMARYRDGLDKQAQPMEKGKVYKLEFPCNSTAIVFNKGHRIGVHVTSSSTPAYEVHPNTYEPVNSMDKAVVANHTLHCSKEHQSKVILPVVTASKP